MFSSADLQADRNEVVVGLDDSPAGRAALWWAARYARFTFTDLRAVHVLPAWGDASWAWTVGTAALAGPALTEWMDDTIAGTTHIFEAVAPELDWSLEHVVGTPGPVLVAAAAHAQLLIVGTRHAPESHGCCPGRSVSTACAAPSVPSSPSPRCRHPRARPRAQFDVSALV